MCNVAHLSTVEKSNQGYTISMKKLELRMSVKPFHVNQYFGNPDPKYKELGLPAHNGMDFYAPHGTPVRATHDGLAYYEIDDKGGHGVVVTTLDEFEYKGQPVQFKTIYWHLIDSSKESIFKSPVEGFTSKNPLAVKQGDVIGYADSTGFSNGHHLHFGLKPGYFTKKNVWVNVEQNNSYFGAIDPQPYFIDWPFQFTRDLELGMKGPDVVELQKFLNRSAFLIAADGPGSPGHETDYFGPLTLAAVKKLQKAYGIWPQFGYFGSKTRKTVNSILLLPLNI